MQTFKQGFDRLTEAYINGEVNAYDCHFCFCGNLENSSLWSSVRYQNMPLNLEYTKEQYIAMESAFMKPIREVLHIEPEYFRRPSWQHDMIDDYNSGKIDIPGYEDALWIGFNNALNTLKQIHIERGEDVDADLKMIKRDNRKIVYERLNK